MGQVTITIPDDMLAAVGSDPRKVAEELCLLAAVKLYEMGRLSSGAASDLAGIPKPLFLLKLADFGIPALRLSDEELEREVAGD